MENELPCVWTDVLSLWNYHIRPSLVPEPWNLVLGFLAPLFVIFPLPCGVCATIVPVYVLWLCTRFLLPWTYTVFYSLYYYELWLYYYYVFVVVPQFLDYDLLSSVLDCILFVYCAIVYLCIRWLLYYLSYFLLPVTVSVCGLLIVHAFCN